MLWPIERLTLSTAIEHIEARAFFEAGFRAMHSIALILQLLTVSTFTVPHLWVDYWPEVRDVVAVAHHMLALSRALDDVEEALCIRLGG